MTELKFIREPTEERFVNEPQEEVWLPHIGPTAWLLAALLRKEVERVDVVTWEYADLASRLGVSPATGQNSPLMRSINRLCRFGLIVEDPDGTYRVYRGWRTPRPKRSHASAS